MELMLVLTFLGAFVAIALPLIAASSGPTKESKQVMTALDSVLASEEQVRRENIPDLRKDEQLSSIPWLNQKLHNVELGPLLRRLLDQADLKWSVGRLLVLCGVCGLAPACLVAQHYRNFSMALMTGLITASAPIMWAFHRRAKRLEQFVKDLPEALDLMVSGLRAGHSLIAAVGLVARECSDPVGCEFRTRFDEQNYGLELKAAMENMIKRVPVQDLRIVSSAIMIQKESGGNLAEVLDKASHAIRDRFRLKRQISVHTAQGRLTGLILTFLPLFLGIAIYFINPDMMSILWKRPVGVKLLCGSGVMTVLGGLIIRQIVNMDV
jgi:tight adherence protein B